MSSAEEVLVDVGPVLLNLDLDLVLEVPLTERPFDPRARSLDSDAAPLGAKFLLSAERDPVISSSEAMS